MRSWRRLASRFLERSNITRKTDFMWGGDVTAQPADPNGQVEGGNRTPPRGPAPKLANIGTMIMINTGTRVVLAATFAAFTAIAGPAFAQGDAGRPGGTLQMQPTATIEGTAPGAASAPGGSAAGLNALVRDWDRAGFDAPSKPLQYRVTGRNGYATDGAGYAAMVTLIRSATKDSRDGREQDALVKIASARHLLDRSARSGEHTPQITN
jgi:hypothetical protein